MWVDFCGPEPETHQKIINKLLSKEVQCPTIFFLQLNLFYDSTLMKEIFWC